MKASLHRPTRAIIDLGAICFNVEQISRHIPKGVKKFAVVKANAYGHGVIAVAKSLQDKVDAFCVSNIDEALELREAAIELPILILGVSAVESIPLAIEHRITLTVASKEWLALALATYPDLTGLTVHIKIDSGMGRIGFRDLSVLNESLTKLQAAGADIEGVFTHFATADEKEVDHFEQQLHQFRPFVEKMEIRPRLVHASNSATTLWHSDTIMQAVRLGDVMYGLNPSGSVLELPYEIKPALRLESELVHVKEIEPGSKVGYGATYEAKEKEFIGTVPIGYADGWTRDMQGFSVLVDGQFCPIVGRVSMDQITIHLPKSYPLGTPVVLIGRSGASEISATDVAEQRGTINYEVVCLLSDRVPRDYKAD